MNFDLKQLSNEVQNDDTAIELEINDREGEPYLANGKPVVLLVVGEYSKAYREAERSITNKVLKAARAGADVTADDVERRSLERLAGGVAGWRNVIVDGKEAAFSREGVIALLKAAPWVAKQVEGAIQRHASFFSKPSAA